MLRRLSACPEMPFCIRCFSISSTAKCRDIRLIGESDVPNLGATAVLITVHYLNQYLDNIKSKWVLWEIRSQTYRTYINQ